MAKFLRHLHEGLQFNIFFRFSLSDLLDGPDKPASDPWLEALEDMEQCFKCGNMVDITGEHQQFITEDDEDIYFHIGCEPGEEEDE